MRPKDKRPDEPIENKRARLLYQSRKRGIKENDLLMGSEARKQPTFVCSHLLTIGPPPHPPGPMLQSPPGGPPKRWLPAVTTTVHPEHPSLFKCFLLLPPSLSPVPLLFLLCSCDT